MSARSSKQSLIPHHRLCCRHQQVSGIHVQRIDERNSFQPRRHRRDDEHRCSRLLQPAITDLSSDEGVVTDSPRRQLPCIQLRHVDLFWYVDYHMLLGQREPSCRKKISTAMLAHAAHPIRSSIHPGGATLQHGVRRVLEQACLVGRVPDIFRCRDDTGQPFCAPRLV